MKTNMLTHNKMIKWQTVMKLQRRQKVAFKNQCNNILLGPYSYNNDVTSLGEE